MPSMGESADRETELEARSVLLREVRAQNIAARIADVGSEAARALETGQTILTLGNGGSAAQAQHLAAELVGRFRTERRGLRSVALTADTAVLTALGNDYGFETVFRRQVQAHVVAGEPSTDAAQIQVTHLVICHLLCAVIDHHLRARGLA